MSLLYQPHPSRSPLFSSPRLQSLFSSLLLSPPPPPSVELLCCADRELICLPHLSPPPRGPRVRRRRAPVKRLLCLLLAASPPLRGCADSASLSLLSGALSTEPVSGRQGSAERRWGGGVSECVRACACVRLNHTIAQLERDRREPGRQSDRMS